MNKRTPSIAAPKRIPTARRPGHETDALAELAQPTVTTTIEWQNRKRWRNTRPSRNNGSSAASRAECYFDGLGVMGRPKKLLSESPLEHEWQAVA